MRKTLLALSAAAAMMAPTSAALAHDHPGHEGKKTTRANAAQACKQQRATLGVDAFRQLYGTNHNRRNAFGRCVSKMQTTSARQRAAILSAAQACKQEQAANPDAFAQKYGTNHNHRNAFGKCVSSKVPDEHDS